MPRQWQFRTFFYNIEERKNTKRLGEFQRWSFRRNSILSDVPREFGNFTDKVVVRGFFTSLGVKMNQTNVVPEGNCLSSLCILGMDTVFKGIFLSLGMKIDVFVRSKGVAALDFLRSGFAVFDGD
jgi:hypothetical protein